MTITALKIIDSLIERLKGIGCKVYFNHLGLDLREPQEELPVSLVLLEETPIHQKADCYKHELALSVQAFCDYPRHTQIFHLIDKIKTTLLNPKPIFEFSYLGYEIDLPEDGSAIMRIKIKFKACYFENI